MEHGKTISKSVYKNAWHCVREDARYNDRTALGHDLASYRACCIAREVLDSREEDKSPMPLEKRLESFVSWKESELELGEFAPLSFA